MHQHHQSVKLKTTTKTHRQTKKPYLVTSKIYAHLVRQDIKCPAKFILF